MFSWRRNALSILKSVKSSDPKNAPLRIVSRTSQLIPASKPKIKKTALCSTTCFNGQVDAPIEQQSCEHDQTRLQQQRIAQEQQTWEKWLSQRNLLSWMATLPFCPKNWFSDWRRAGLRSWDINNQNRSIPVAAPSSQHHGQSSKTTRSRQDLSGLLTKSLKSLIKITNQFQTSSCRHWAASKRSWFSYKGVSPKTTEKPSAPACIWKDYRWSAKTENICGRNPVNESAKNDEEGKFRNQ